MGKNKNFSKQFSFPLEQNEDAVIIYANSRKEIQQGNLSKVVEDYKALQMQLKHCDKNDVAKHEELEAKCDAYKLVLENNGCSDYKDKELIKFLENDAKNPENAIKKYFQLKQAYDEFNWLQKFFAIFFNTDCAKAKKAKDNYLSSITKSNILYFAQEKNETTKDYLNSTSEEQVINDLKAGKNYADEVADGEKQSWVCFLESACRDTNANYLITLRDEEHNNKNFVRREFSDIPGSTVIRETSDGIQRIRVEEKGNIPGNNSNTNTNEDVPQTTNENII